MVFFVLLFVVLLSPINGQCLFYNCRNEAKNGFVVKQPKHSFANDVSFELKNKKRDKDI